MRIDAIHLDGAFRRSSSCFPCLWGDANPTTGPGVSCPGPWEEAWDRLVPGLPFPRAGQTTTPYGRPYPASGFTHEANGQPYKRSRQATGSAAAKLFLQRLEEMASDNGGIDEEPVDHGMRKPQE